jgi:uncharacterized Ntn-hydrolase superfamily protein
MDTIYISTFSIVACDLKTEEWGVAVQSKFLAVGPVVPWAQAKVGAIATQSYANTSYGPRGLEMLQMGFSAKEVLNKLVELDEGRDQRQVGVVDSKGQAAAFTGKECYGWAGHITGKCYAVQGNILVGKETIESMAEAFENTKDTLANRLIKALEAGQAAGGDRRGQQSASLLIVKEKGGYGGFTDRLIDLRVDDHPQPIAELKRLLGLWKLYFGKTEKTVSLKGEIIKEIQQMLGKLGYYHHKITGRLDELTLKAIQDFHNMENLEMRCPKELNKIDEAVLHFMKEKANW